MIKIRIKKPKSHLGKTFLLFFVAFFLVFSVSLSEKEFRKPGELNSVRKACGSISKYYFSRAIRGFSTWRLAIKLNGSSEIKAFNVGDSYIQNNINEKIMTKGKDICIYFTDKHIPFVDPFITQIKLNGNHLLANEEVTSEYMKGISGAEKFILIFSTFMIFVFVIKFKKK